VRLLADQGADEAVEEPDGIERRSSIGDAMERRNEFLDLG
jgi:hypothetical protein